MRTTPDIAVLHLRITPGEGGWRLTLSDGARRPVDGRLSPSAVSAAKAMIAAARPPAMRVMVAGRDAPVTRSEEAVGEALGALLRCAPEVHGRLHALAGRAAGAGALPVLVVDAEVEEARQLPWELLALEGQLPAEVAGEVVLARLTVGGQPRAPREASGLVIKPWCATPEDAACSRLLQQLWTLAEEPAGDFTALHIVAHGRAGVDSVAVSLGGAAGSGALDAGAAGARLASEVSTADLVVMSVCGAGAPVGRELDDLAGRLIACGAASVVAPVREMSAEALARFAEGFYQTLRDAGAPAEAVRAGRAAVRAWGHPHPASRWHGVAWFVRDLRTPAAPPPVAPRWRPGGWPRPDPAAAALLDDARELARASGDGYLGVEHLLEALQRARTDDDRVRRARRWLAGVLAGHKAASAALTPQPAAPGLWSTPRLASWGSRLEDDFDLGALCELLVEAPWPGAAGPSAPPPGGEETWATVEARQEPATHLEVIGGPEDGRRLRPAPGLTIGRHAASGSPEVALYQRAALTDRKLSRQALVWLGGGEVALLRQAHLLRAGATTHLQPGRVALLAGDRLALTRGTCLAARGDTP
jgi:hypothetical protein